MMVEGKGNESFGPLVQDWGPDSSDGKQKRWRYLLNVLDVRPLITR